MNLTCRELIHCNDAAIMQLLNIRNELSVRSAMYTDHVISKEEHLQYISNLKTDSKNLIYVIFGDDNVPVGAAGYNKIDRKHLKTDWAFYLSSTARGIGSAIEWAMIERAFNELGMEKLNCEVIEANSRVVDLHKAFSFEEEGFLKENIIKEQRRIGVHLLGLSKRKWGESRDQVFQKFGRKVRANPIRFS
jgi:UDP-4-amino-4,6-dideoxy-N-acetyl-beta-L-altrosamine N-acetyltransferase